MVIRARKLDLIDQEIVFQRIQYNAYFLHPENVLLSMIADENVIIRKLGWKRLKKPAINWPGWKQTQVWDVLRYPRFFLMPNHTTKPLIGRFGKMTTTTSQFTHTLLCSDIWNTKRYNNGPTKQPPRSLKCYQFHVTRRLWNDTLKWCLTLQ